MALGATTVSGEEPVCGYDLARLFKPTDARAAMGSSMHLTASSLRKGRRSKPRNPLPWSGASERRFSFAP